MTDTASPDLNVRRDGAVAVLEIDRPPANYFDRALIAAIADALGELESDGRTRAAVLCSSGKHFCAGANFATTADGGDRAIESRRLYDEALRLFHVQIPVVAAVQGAAVGGGLGLACAADFRVATPDSVFQANFARLGFHQGFGLSATLPRIVGPQRALDLLSTARRVRGEEAAAIGLADRIVPTGTERAAALTWAAEIAACAPLAVRSIRETLRSGLADAVGQALEREVAEQARLWETEDSREGIAASLERREPRFVGR
ncbi:Enoyl-CoA hydratase/carnithine racemase [Thermomonospora echinospora]|uniref:Enoyl-CoA hydratase/carnithine racemase n=1 Tax=Thermomonospora echinospora TaxID=1992 RepID=A0A1H6E0R5_9ACTN|nr:enoyl-CoA hydratase/isomerase family protein [Thermomonospora echinospora]SEG90515.1 Enoyl-CoA hydratase/carnithine racemase [Thermomonospora echinospora]